MLVTTGELVPEKLAELPPAMRFFYERLVEFSGVIREEHPEGCHVSALIRKANELYRKHGTQLMYQIVASWMLTGWLAGFPQELQKQLHDQHERQFERIAGMFSGALREAHLLGGEHWIDVYAARIAELKVKNDEQPVNDISVGYAMAIADLLKLVDEEGR